MVRRAWSDERLTHEGRGGRIGNSGLVRGEFRLDRKEPHMIDAKSTITLLACCCIVLTIAPAASADDGGVATVIKDDPDTEF